MKKIEFTVREQYGKISFKSPYCGFSNLAPSLAWSGRMITCIGSDDSTRDIHVPEFADLLNGRFQDGDKSFNRLETFHFNVGDTLTIELPDDTAFSYHDYCVELGRIDNSFEANKKLDLVVTEYDGRHFFESVVGPQIFVFDEFSASPFYYASHTSGKIVRAETELCRFVATDRGGMDCYYHYFDGLKAEFSNQREERNGEFDLISASRLEIGDRVELKDSSAFVPALTREWSMAAKRCSFSLKEQGISPRIARSGLIVMDYALEHNLL